MSMTIDQAFEESVAGGDTSVEAGSDLSAGQYHGVVLASDGQMDLATAAGDRIIGILQDKPSAAGKPGLVRHLGTSFVVVGSGGVAKGDKLTMDASGRAVTSSADTDFKFGVARTSASAGELVSVLLGNMGLGGASTQFSLVTVPVILSTADNATVYAGTFGYAGKIKKIFATVTTPTTDTTGKTNVFTVKIATVATTGGVVTIDVDTPAADPDTLGKVIASGAAITAANSFGATDQITIVASNTTPLTDGEILLTMVIANS